MIVNPVRYGSGGAPKQVTVNVSRWIDVIAYMSGGVYTTRASGGNFLVDAGSIMAVALSSNTVPSVSNATRIRANGSLSAWKVADA